MGPAFLLFQSTKVFRAPRSLNMFIWRAASAATPLPAIVPSVVPIVHGVAVVVALPVLHMARGHVHVDRPGVNHGDGPDDDRRRVHRDRLRVDNRRRKVPDGELAIEPGLADADGDADVGSLRRRRGNEGNCNG